MHRKSYTDRYRSNEVYLAIILGCLIAAFLIGYSIGTYTTIKVIADIASGFLSEDLIKAAIFQYKNNIGQCYPSIFENASLHNSTGS